MNSDNLPPFTSIHNIHDAITPGPVMDLIRSRYDVDAGPHSRHVQFVAELRGEVVVFTEVFAGELVSMLVDGLAILVVSLLLLTDSQIKVGD